MAARVGRRRLDVGILLTWRATASGWRRPNCRPVRQSHFGSCSGPDPALPFRKQPVRRRHRPTLQEVLGREQAHGRVQHVRILLQHRRLSGKLQLCAKPGNQCLALRKLLMRLLAIRSQTMRAQCSRGIDFDRCNPLYAGRGPRERNGFAQPRAQIAEQPQRRMRSACNATPEEQPRKKEESAASLNAIRESLEAASSGPLRARGFLLP